MALLKTPFLIFFIMNIIYSVEFTNYINTNTICDISIGKDAVWAGTNGGLVKYDFTGNIIKCYLKPDGLVNNFIVAVCVNKNGNIWIGYSEGVTMFDGYEWIHFTVKEDSLPSAFIFAITPDNNGNIWIGGTKGIGKYENNKWVKYKTPLAKLNEEVIIDIAIDQNNNKWFVRYDFINDDDCSVCKFDDNEWTCYDTSDGILSSKIVSVEIDISNNLWVGTASGVSKFDGNIWTSYKIGSSLSDSIVMDIKSDTLGNVWFATKKALTKFDGENWTVYSDSNFYGINDIEIDSKGDVWLGSGLTCLSKFDGNSFKNYADYNSISDNRIIDLIADSFGNVWFVVLGGVDKFDGEKFVHFTKNDGLITNNVLSVAIDTSGTKWFGNGFGLNSFDGNLWKTFTISDGLADNYIATIAVDNNNNIWCGNSWTSTGVSKYDGESWTICDTSNSGIIGNDITSIIADNNSNVWFGGLHDRLCKLDALGNWSEVKLDNGLKIGRVQDMVIDIDSSLWIGTNNGLCHYYKGKLKTYTPSDGLVGKNITSIAIDRNGNKWIGTAKGLNKFDGKYWFTYTTKDGIVSNSIGSLSIDINDNIWIGTSSGVSMLRDSLVTVINPTVTNKILKSNLAIRYNGEKINVQYSNPVTGNVSLILYDLKGKCHYSISGHKKFGTHSSIINTSDFSTGTYICRLKTANHDCLSKKILIVK